MYGYCKINYFAYFPIVCYYAFMDLDIKEKVKQWCPPNVVLQRWNELVEVFGFQNVDTKGDFKKAREMRSVAIALLGLHTHDNFEYMLQIPTEKDQSPDSIKMPQFENSIRTKYQTIEVVMYEPRSEGEVCDFIITKLRNKKRDYDKDTIILCSIHKDFSYIDFPKVYSKFSKVHFKPEKIYILGEMKQNKNWVISQVWPNIEHIQFDFVKEANAYSVKGLFPKRAENIGKEYLPVISTLSMYTLFGLNEIELIRKYSIQ